MNHKALHNLQVPFFPLTLVNGGLIFLTFQQNYLSAFSLGGHLHL